MNDRKRTIERYKKNKDRAKRRDLHKMFDLVLDINGLEPRECDITGTLPTAFFEFSGHTADVCVRVHKYGWLSGQSPEYADLWSSGRTLKERIKSLEKLSHELAERKSHEPT